MVKIIEKLKYIIFTDQTINIFSELNDLKNNKISLILFFCFLPITFLFLIVNFLIYIISYIMYVFMFITEIIKVRIFKKKHSFIFHKKIFEKLQISILVFFKNMFLEYPKMRAFDNFYSIGKILKNKTKTSFNTKINFLFYFIKTLFNRYLLILILGTPYLVLYCNIRFVERFIMIYSDNKRENGSISNFIFSFLLNISCDLMPICKIYIDDLKIKIYKNEIIYNPYESLLNKAVIELAKNFNLSREINTVSRYSKINFIKNLKKIDINNEKIWSEKHLETTLLIDNESQHTISVNETSQRMVGEIPNIYYGNCTYKYGDCYITKPILSKLEWKSTVKNSINYKIINIDYDKIKYNQILALILNLNSGYIQGEFVNKFNCHEFFYSESKTNLINLIRENKSFMNKATYESLENANYFCEQLNYISSNLDLTQKCNLWKSSWVWHSMTTNNDIYQLLKLK